MQLSDAIYIVLASSGVFMGLMYLLAQIKRDTSIVDIAWGLGFVVAGVNLYLAMDGDNALFKLVQVLVTIWGLRLFLHIFIRKAGSDEDWRYANWREEWGKNHWWRSFLQVFMLQGFLMSVIAAPLIVSWASSDTSIPPLAYVGAAVWAFGFYFEAVGDYQLSQFIKWKKETKKNKKKKKIKTEFMTQGLWRYTRHPNYFGEVTQWWGLWLIVVGAPYGLWAIVSPITITYLLLKVSGIPMLEKKWADDKEFKKYKKRTNAFFPGPPKRK